MDKKIRELYGKQIRDLEEDEISIKLKKQVRKILEMDIIDERRVNERLDTAFRIAEAGEEAGFVRGFRYAIQLITECR